MKVCKIRLLRLKYGITTTELGRACGYASQSISRIELCSEAIPESARHRLLKGFYDIARQRQDAALALIDDLACHEESLFEGVEETEYEL